MTEEKIKIERDYPTSVEEVWKLWTTRDGIEAWWAPDGFTVEVNKLDLVSGGELHYSMTASGPEQIAFMEKAGMPLRTEARKTFTGVEPAVRLAYLSLVDYVPDVQPYEHGTEVAFSRSGDDAHVVMTMEPMHDQDWTQRLVAGRSNELDNLAKLIDARRGDHRL